MAALLLSLAMAGVDSQHLQSMDGGRYPALMEPDLGVENTLAASFALHVGSELAVLRTSTGDTVLVDRVTTQDFHVSMNVFDAARIGIGLPRHRPVVFEGVTQPRSYAGDFAIFVQGPLSESERFRSTLSAQLDLPLGSQTVWLGDQDPALEARVSGELKTGRLHTLVNLGSRLTRTVFVPGMRWGNHWVWGLGSRWEPYGPLGLTGELFGRTPINPIGGAPGSYPVELLATVDVRLGPVTLGFGGGRGLTRGLGSPASRFLGRLDIRPHKKSDRDGDGIGDIRDVCPQRPEDLDEYRDADGCPDEDNDEDGILDASDACPNRPEVFNQWRDQDGCPDAHAMLEVFVLPEDRPPAMLAWQGRTREVPPDRPVFVDVDAGSVELVARADGFLEQREVTLIEDGSEDTVVLELDPVPVARLVVVVADPGGVPVMATLDETAVPEEGLILERDVGPFEARITAPGFFPSELSIDLEAGENRQEVVLQPASMDASVGFELDSAKLTDAAVAYLETLLAYLGEHPEVKLVRVEGEADDAGTSAYNYKLSTARAEVVRAWLVERGIEPDRLQAIGSGEARSEERQVRFRVLIWD